MFKKILVIFILVLVGLFGFAAMQPSDFRVIRGINISASPETIFPHVNDFHNWEAWSPWAKLDPAAKNSFEGPSAGKGAIFKWAGNYQVGEGSMTIIQSESPHFIQIKLEFIKPFPGTNTAEFTFIPQASETAVTWTMYGKRNLLGKAIGLFVDCDKMVGEMFEKGLEQMKKVVEKK